MNDLGTIHTVMVSVLRLICTRKSNSLTHSFGLRYRSSILRCSKNEDRPTRLYAT